MATQGPSAYIVWLPKNETSYPNGLTRPEMMSCVANHFRCTKWTSESSWGRPATPRSVVILYIVGQDQPSFQPSSGPKDNFGKEWEGIGYTQRILTGYSLAPHSALLLLLLLGGSGDHSGCWGSIPDQTYKQGKHPTHCNNSPAWVSIWPE